MHYKAVLSYYIDCIRTVCTLFSGAYTVSIYLNACQYPPCMNIITLLAAVKQ